MANICMIGTGYVGLVTGAGLAKLGHKVTCVDIDKEKIERLKNEKVSFYEQDLSQLVQDGIYCGRLFFTTHLGEATNDAEYIIIAVATPQSPTGDADMSQLYSVSDDLARLIKKFTFIVVKSTVPVGCFQYLKKRLIDRGLEESNFTLVSCPEFLAEGNALNDFFHPSRTIVGADKLEDAEKVAKLFDGVDGPIVLTTVEAAQLIKYASNSFLALRVAFINEISRVCEFFEVDVSHVSQGMLLDSRFGSGYLRAGIGFGGPCLPKDLNALTQTALKVGIKPLVCEAANSQNAFQVDHVSEMILNMSKSGDKIVIFGLSFKAGTSDVRNSLALKIIEKLTSSDRTVVVSDPKAFDYDDQKLFRISAQKIKNPWVAAKDTSVQAFLTAWPEYEKLDLRTLKNIVRVPAIFDGPGIFDPREVIKIGYDYVGIGRLKPRSFMIIKH